MNTLNTLIKYIRLSSLTSLTLILSQSDWRQPGALNCKEIDFTNLSSPDRPKFELFKGRFIINS